MLICAALLVQVEGLNHTTVLPCRRHGDGFEILRDFGCSLKTNCRVIEEGFIDHNGAFLDRHDAWQYAKMCGQLSQSTEWYKEDNRDCELYSEDLY